MTAERRTWSCQWELSHCSIVYTVACRQSLCTTDVSLDLLLVISVPTSIVSGKHCITERHSVESILVSKPLMSQNCYCWNKCRVQHTECMYDLASSRNPLLWVIAWPPCNCNYSPTLILNPLITWFILPSKSNGFFLPNAGSGVVRMDPLRFLGGCLTRHKT